jgi:hypothetical protein
MFKIESTGDLELELELAQNYPHYMFTLVRTFGIETRNGKMAKLEE